MRLLVFLVVLILSSTLHAQDATWDEPDEEDMEENEFRQQENAFQKIEINAVNEPDAQMLLWADSSVWYSITRHRKNTGWYFSVYEIQSIPELDSATVLRLIPILSAEYVPGKWKRELSESDLHYLMLRSDMKMPEAISGKYRRSLKDKHLLSCSFRKISASQWTLRGNAWMQFRKLRILAGHYKMDWGQGLLLGTYAPGKNAEPIRSVAHLPMHDIPWNSSGMHQRGVAFRYSVSRKWKMMWQLSDKKDPAVVRNAQLQYWLWQPQANAQRVHEQTISGAILHSTQRSEAGILLLYSRTSVPVKVYNATSHIAVSGYLRKRFGQKSFTAEVVQLQRSIAGTASLIFPLNAKWEGAFNVRGISAGYFSRYMNGFGLNYNTPAVLAAYQALRYYLNRSINIAVGYDHIQSPGDKERQSYMRSELGATMQVKFNRSHNLLLKVRSKHYRDDNDTTHEYRWQLQQSVDALPFRIKARVQGGFSELGQSLVAGSELEYKISKISLLVGVSFFKVGHYSLKESWYERPVFLSSGFSWLYNDGTHRYLMLNYKPTDRIKFWLRGFWEEDTTPVGGILIQALYTFL